MQLLCGNGNFLPNKRIPIGSDLFMKLTNNGEALRSFIHGIDFGENNPMTVEIIYQSEEAYYDEIGDLNLDIAITPSSPR